MLLETRLETRIELRIPQWLKADMDFIADTSKISRSELVRTAVIEYLMKQAKTPVA
jgi:metal-responsive CopG/Arc/MetJ family transcriptional regulator